MVGRATRRWQPKTKGFKAGDRLFYITKIRFVPLATKIFKNLGYSFVFAQKNAARRISGQDKMIEGGGPPFLVEEGWFNTKKSWFNIKSCGMIWWGRGNVVIL